MKVIRLRLGLFVLEARANKSGIKFMIFILYSWNIVYDAIHDFSVWLRTGSNPADIDPFRSHTGNTIKFSNSDF